MSLGASEISDKFTKSSCPLLKYYLSTNSTHPKKVFEHSKMKMILALLIKYW